MVETLAKRLTGRWSDREAQAIESERKTASKASFGPVIGTLTLPNGETIQTVRSDVFRNALAAIGRKAHP
jgi:hypothetical protein